MTQSLPPYGPFSLSQGRPVEIHGRVLGLKTIFKKKMVSTIGPVYNWTYNFRKAWNTPDKKKVSCWSLAGCCWGWNSESKFQNELSIKLLVGISVKLKKQNSLCVILSETTVRKKNDKKMFCNLKVLHWLDLWNTVCSSGNVLKLFFFPMKLTHQNNEFNLWISDIKLNIRREKMAWFSN